MSDLESVAIDTDLVQQNTPLTREDILPGDSYIKDTAPELHQKMVNYFAEQCPGTTEPCVGAQRVVYVNMGNTEGTPTIVFFGKSTEAGNQAPAKRSIIISEFEKNASTLTPEEKKIIMEAAKKNPNIDYRGLD